MPYALQFAIVLIAMFVADVCWTFYFIKIEERKSLAASLWGVGIYICGAFTVMSYTEDKTFAIAAIMGSFLGTYLSIEWKKRKEKKHGNTK